MWGVFVKMPKGFPRFRAPLLPGGRRPSIRFLLPSGVTVLALSAGMSAIRYGMAGEWEKSILAILIAAILDLLDGRIARMLNACSSFGAELDSLSDFVSFGVAPALLLYMWTMKAAGSLGWIAVTAFAICSALRLARFNVLHDEAVPPYAEGFFVGLPMPAAACLGLMPLTGSFGFGMTFLSNQLFVAVWTLLVAMLMISRLPVVSVKKVRFSPLYAAPALLLGWAIVALLLTEPLVLSFVFGILMIALMPFGFVLFERKRKAFLAHRPMPVELEGDEE